MYQTQIKKLHSIMMVMRRKLQFKVNKNIKKSRIIKYNIILLSISKKNKIKMKII